MKTIIIIFWFLLTMLTMDSLAQSLWEFEPAPSDYFITNNDTSYLTLKNYLQNDSLAFETPYLSVANLFAYYYGNSEKDFILEKLQIFYDTTQPKFNWNNFFSAQVLRGFLGDQGAIEGLDSVIRYSNNMLLKLSAISYLYEVGILDYFQTIKQAFMEQNSLYNGFVQLAQYGSDERFKDEAAALLAGVITDSTDRIKTFSAATNLASFNKLLAIQSLESRFYSSNGEDRLNFFMDLEFIDPDGQPERSMYAIPLETDVYIRSEFFPPTGSAEKGLVTRRYLEPFWINFIKEWYNYESEKIIKSSILRYIEDFEPNIIDSTSSTLELIEDLIDLTDTVYNYSWLGDEQFKNELQSILQLAKSNLQNGDSLACRVQVKTFQGLVDNVYKDSLNTDLSFVTIEGWKFLYWNAQYILDRLPQLPVNADIEEINPAMSLVNPGAFKMEVKGTGFTANSVVYFNGNARTTTFVTDTLLTAEILGTDVSVAGNYPVWVSSGTTNSDTVIYKVVNTLPKPVRPVLECVRNNGDGTYTAYFGYKNDNTVSVYIPLGSKNKFTPTQQDRGQTRVFLPGRKYKVFTVNFNGSNLVWTLNGRTSTASSNSAPCN
ncbi:hypothetical protein [Ignavibacterium sp.]|uniref:hypothetical protein n=1 Tax=Ignavibacterium sp. TaxID=2651167 RepID=UPI00220A478E|nr:hypothetical protein [Ignavibacterium sp.]BDQ02954.1 MAG: hypothetical protein KatS3mg037_1529 [Ignavibacterium sp.]